MKYEIHYLGKGTLGFAGRTIRNIEVYNDERPLPVFDSEVDPVTPGLKLYESKGLVKVVEITKANQAKKAAESKAEPKAKEKAPEAETPKAEEPKAEEKAPEAETPKAEEKAPEAETPKAEEPKAEEPKAEEKPKRTRRTTKKKAEEADGE